MVQTQTADLNRENISSPSAGLFARNLRDSVAGAHPVPCLDPLAGFSHPRNPKISRIAFGPDCSGERNVLQQNPLSGRGVGPCDAHRKNGLSRPVERGRLKPFINLDRHFPRTSWRNLSPCVWNTFLICLIPAQPSAERPRKEREFCLKEIH